MIEITLNLRFVYSRPASPVLLHPSLSLPLMPFWQSSCGTQRAALTYSLSRGNLHSSSEGGSNASQDAAECKLPVITRGTLLQDRRLLILLLTTAAAVGLLKAEPLTREHIYTLIHTNTIAQKGYAVIIFHPKVCMRGYTLAAQTISCFIPQGFHIGNPSSLLATSSFPQTLTLLLLLLLLFAGF